MLHSLRQETHRVYFQTRSSSQSSSDTTTNTNTNTNSKKQLTTTRTATIRLTESATGDDVVRLLRRKFELDGNYQKSTSTNNDVLVVVGTNSSISSVPFSSLPSLTTSSTCPGPLHLIQTIQPHEKLLSCRDHLLHCMEQKVEELLTIRLESNNESSVNHKPPSSPSYVTTIQWFFVPDSYCSEPTTNNTNTNRSPKILFNPLKSYIQLPDDGYCTSVDEEEDDESSLEEDTNKADVSSNTRINEDTNYDSTTMAKVTSHNTTCRVSTVQKKKSTIQRHVHRWAIFNEQVLTPPISFAIHGFLQLQSTKDTHVWKHVYCILSQDHFWILSRRKTTTTNNNNNPPGILYTTYQKLSLVEMVVQTPNEGDTMFILLQRTNPTVTKSTTKHYCFCAARRDLQLRWVEAIANSIVSCTESNYIHMAEMIGSDEEYSRALRLENDILKRCLADATASSNQPPAIERTCYLWSLTGHGGEFVDLLRFGILLQEYREACRHYTRRSSVNNWSTSTSGDATTATVKEIKLAQQHALQETAKHVSSLWEMAATVCALSAVPDSSVNTPSSTSKTVCDRGNEKYDILEDLENLRNKLFCDIQETIHTLLDIKASSADLAVNDIPSPPDLNLFDKIFELRIKLAKYDEMQHKVDGLFGF